MRPLARAFGELSEVFDGLRRVLLKEPTDDLPIDVSKIAYVPGVRAIRFSLGG
jgi:hypothetical protein